MCVRSVYSQNKANINEKSFFIRGGGFGLFAGKILILNILLNKTEHWTCGLCPAREIVLFLFFFVPCYSIFSSLHIFVYAVQFFFILYSSQRWLMASWNWQIETKQLFIVRLVCFNFAIKIEHKWKICRELTWKVWKKMHLRLKCCKLTWSCHEQNFSPVTCKNWSLFYFLTMFCN